MVSTIRSQASTVGNDHHNRHNHHSGDLGDGRDGESPLVDADKTAPPADQPTLTPQQNPIEVIEAALIRLKDDVGVLAEEAVVQAFSVLRATDMSAYLRLRHQAKGANRDCSVTMLDKLVQQELPGGGEERSAMDALVEMARAQCHLHHDADRTAVAIIPMPGCQEVWRVQSSGYEAWLRAAYWRATETGIPDMTMRAALATLCAAGVNDGREVEIYLRAAVHANGYLIDVCDAQWRAIHVTCNGWRVLDASPLLFTRNQSMRPLPMPERGGQIDTLWQHVNVPADRRLMVLTWLLDCFRPETPFPVPP